MKRAAKSAADEWATADLDGILNSLNPIQIDISKIVPDGKTKSLPLLQLFSSLRDVLITGVTNQYGSSDYDKLAFYNVLPKLEVHGLAATENVPDSRYQRYRLTPKGIALLVHMDQKAGGNANSPES